MQTSLAGAVLLLAVSALVASTTAINFYSPKYYGVPIDFCPSLSSKPEDCGMPAATLYCQRAGYDRAIYFEGPMPANKTVAMQLMMDGKPRPVWNTTGGHMEYCEAKNGKTRSTFLMVYCIHDKMFLYPSVDGKALDWCGTDWQGKASCGNAAADAFCVRNGFSHGAWSFNGPIPVSAVEPAPKTLDTIMMDGRNETGPGKVCSSKQGDCKTFVSVNCEL